MQSVKSALHSSTICALHSPLPYNVPRRIVLRRPLIAASTDDHRWRCSCGELTHHDALPSHRSWREILVRMQHHAVRRFFRVFTSRLYLSKVSCALPVFRTMAPVVAVFRYAHLTYLYFQDNLLILILYSCLYLFYIYLKQCYTHI